jgi:hypothetical protein
MRDAPVHYPILWYTRPEIATTTNGDPFHILFGRLEMTLSGSESSSLRFLKPDLIRTWWPSTRLNSWLVEVEIKSNLSLVFDPPQPAKDYQRQVRLDWLDLGRSLLARERRSVQRLPPLTNTNIHRKRVLSQADAS